MGLKNTEQFTEQMQTLTYFAMGIGLLWAVLCLIIGGMLLSGSGSNPSKRNLGITAILLACVGLYIVSKSYTIAGWAISIG